MDIKLIGVSKRFGTYTALDNINLDINSANFLAITGDSGSGKTTLLTLITGLARASQGRIFFDGRLLTPLAFSLRSFSLRNRFSIIFQSPVLLKNLTARDNILFPYLASQRRRKDLKQRYQELMEVFRFGSKQNHFPFQLSGGEIQKVAVMRSLLKPADVLIADEPTRDLDAVTVDRLRLVFQRLNREGTTIVMASHNERLNDIAKDRFLLQQGRLTKK